MASCSKPSLQGRRLSEILGEQQEPFLLQIYLSENGCSDRLLRCRPSSTSCWLLKLSNTVTGLRKKGGIFRTIFDKLVQAKVLLKALNCIELGDRKMCQFDCFCGVAEEDISSSPSTSSINSAEVSWIFERLLNYYQSPASKEVIMDSAREKLWRYREGSDSENAKKFLDLQIKCWKKQKEEISNISKLADLEITGTTKKWTDFKHEMREVGSEIEAIIFEEMKGELVLDMLHFQCT